ncbi:MAG TPA: winged helix family transcriptional regulator [Chloroflexi bacterium]|nr:winged helix family transcriptional regulator [Chloroflexota bacterium]
MHVLILAPTHEVAETMRSAIEEPNDECSIALSWDDVGAAMNAQSLDCIFVERSALAQVDPVAQLKLLKPEHYPPVICVDVSSAVSPKVHVTAKHIAQSFSPSYQVGELHIDTRKKRVGIDGRWVYLPPLQYRLLLTLARRAGEVVSYREILKAVWGHDGRDDEARELIKVHICQIRRRLDLDPDERYIQSVRGFGYMLTLPEDVGMVSSQ